MAQQESAEKRPLFFIAGYPRSGGDWVRALVYLTHILGQPEADRKAIDNLIPWDFHGKLYQMASGTDFRSLSEEDVAAARPKVHHLLSTRFPGLPLVRTQAMRGSFYGHPTINPNVMGGAVYVVRNPLDVAAAMVDRTGLKPIKVVALMIEVARRVRQHAQAVVEPQGSWSQNVESWTDGVDPKVKVVRVEDLRADPRTEFAAILEHMGRPVPADRLEKALSMIEGALRDEGEGGAPRDFTSHLKPLEARALIEVTAREMDRHGYLTEDVLSYAVIGREEALRLSAKHNQKAAPDIEIARQ